MSISNTISLWKQKAEIDYFPLFISLWLSLNAWMKYEYTESTDRDILELIKNRDNHLFEKFGTLLHASNADGDLFRGNLGELHRALENARINYNRYDEWKNYIISFNSCPIVWDGEQPRLESIIKTKFQKSKIKINDQLWFDNDNRRLFAAYIEILYQVRCLLFHGGLAPNKDHERVIKQLYLTLSMIMENI